MHEYDFYSARCVGTHYSEDNNKMDEKKYLHRWFLPFNGMQDWTPYVGRPVGNTPEFMPLDNNINIEIFHSLCFS